MGDQEINVLRSKLSVSICGILTERISMLKQFGLTGLWLNADSNDEFNAGTVLGYSYDDWQSIKIYSGLWNPRGNIQKEEIWVKKLKVIVSHRQVGKYRTKWFRFGNICSDEGLSCLEVVFDDPSVPGDEISLSRIKDFYYTMDSRIVHYGTRFSRELR